MSREVEEGEGGGGEEEGNGREGGGEEEGKERGRVEEEGKGRREKEEKGRGREEGREGVRDEEKGKGRGQDVTYIYLQHAYLFHSNHFLIRQVMKKRGILGKVFRKWLIEGHLW